MINNSIITAIFKGEKGQQDNMPNSPKLDMHIKKFWEYENLLKSLLNDEQKAVLDLYDKEQGDIEVEREALSFREGFKLGLLIGIECSGVCDNK